MSTLGARKDAGGGGTNGTHGSSPGIVKPVPQSTGAATMNDVTWLRSEADLLDTLRTNRVALQNAYNGASGVSPQQPTLSENDRLTNVVGLAGKLAADLSVLVDDGPNALRNIAIHLETLLAGGAPSFLAVSTVNGPVNDSAWLRNTADLIWNTLIDDRNKLKTSLDNAVNIYIKGNSDTVDRLNSVIYESKSTVTNMSLIDSDPARLKSIAASIDSLWAQKQIKDKSASKITPSKLFPITPLTKQSSPINSPIVSLPTLPSSPVLPSPFPTPQPLPTTVPGQAPATSSGESTSSSSAAVTADNPGHLFTKNEETVIGIFEYASIAAAAFGGAWLLMRKPKSKAVRRAR